MAAIVLPGSVHDPATGSIAPATWGDAVNAAIAWLANPPRVRVTRSATQSLNDNTVTNLTWNTEQYDTDTMHDNSTNTERLTCATAGLYEFRLGVEFAADADGFRGIQIIHSADGAIAKFYLPAVVVAVTPILQCATEYRMTAGQYVYAQGWHTAGNALIIGSSLWDFFQARWVAS